MTATIRTDWVVRVLRFIPAPLHRALDAWSHRLAQKRRARRLAHLAPTPAAAPIKYRLQPWRD